MAIRRPLKGARLRSALETNEIEGEELDSYIKRNAANRAMVLNIESQAAIDNLEDMLAPELGVDAVLIGPHDLRHGVSTCHRYVGPCCCAVRTEPCASVVTLL